MNYILDTNVISEVISKKPNKKVLNFIDNLDPESLYLTIITLGEIRKGIEKLPASPRRKKLSQWLEGDLLFRFHGKILDITTDVALIWGRLVGKLETEGRILTAVDSLIAAIALEGNYTLVTRNEKDFRNTGVQIINPWNI